MSDKHESCRPNVFKDGVCIHTDQVYDSCKEKDCLEDLKVILTRCGQELVDEAINVKIKCAEIIWVYTDIEPVPFNRGFFTIDIKYFFKVVLDVFRCVGRPVEVEGLATFDKKVILFGSEGNSKTFSSKFDPGSCVPQMWEKNNLPKAVVEVVDPIALSAKLVEDCCGGCNPHHHGHGKCEFGIPENICRCFEDDLVLDGGEKNVVVSLGLFSIIKIERNVQLLIPAIDFCVPHKECLTASEDNPCELFESLRFPLDEFFPPQREREVEEQMCKCNKPVSQCCCKKERRC